MSNTPTDDELKKLAKECGIGWAAGLGGMDDFLRAFARAVLAKWGTPPSVAGEPVMWAYQYSDGSWHDASATEYSAGMKPLYPAQQPTQPQVGAGVKTVHQFRKKHCADWHDGFADHSDGGGPYEERTLYTSGAVPLTDAQIAEMMRGTWGCASIAPRHALEFARTVERAHGITQKGGS